MPSNHKQGYLEWLADLNNILFANGSDQIIGRSDGGAQFDFGTGDTPHEAATRLLGTPVTPPAPVEVPLQPILARTLATLTVAEAATLFNLAFSGKSQTPKVLELTHLGKLECIEITGNTFQLTLWKNGEMKASANHQADGIIATRFNACKVLRYLDRLGIDFEQP